MTHPTFRPCAGFLEIPGDHAKYRIDITCDVWPNASTEEEATAILHQIKSLMDEYADNYKPEDVS